MLPAPQRIMAVDYRFPPGAPVSEAGKDLVARMLVKDPNTRITVQGIYEHPWWEGDGG